MQDSVTNELTSELCIEVINNYKSLRYLLSKIQTSICNHDIHLPSKFFSLGDGTLNIGSTRQNIANFLNRLEYSDKQDPRQIIVGPGIVAASLATCNLVEKINLAKLKFKESVLLLRKHKINMKNKILNDMFEETFNQNIRGEMKRMGFARIHLKQCYRQIPLLTRAPSKVSWTWANTRSIKTITRQEAIEILQGMRQDVGIKLQIQKAMNLGVNEKLAIVQELAPHLRANLVFTKDDIVSRKMIKGPVPIFYPHSTGAFPSFKDVQEKQGKRAGRMIRNDVLLEEEIFLPALRAHRYAK